MTPVRRRLIIGAAAVLAVLLVAYLVTALSSGTKAPPGSTVAAIDIGGMTADQAAQAVEEQLGPLSRKRLRVEALDLTFKFLPEEAGLALDADASVAPAFGRTWNPFWLLGNIFGSPQLPAVTAVDDALLTTQLDVIAEAVDVPAAEPVLVVDADGPQLTAGVAGRALDRDAAAESIIDAVTRARTPVQATVVRVEPIVPDQAAQESVALAEAAIASPVTVTAQSVTATIPSGAIGRALSFTAQGAELVPILDGAVLHRSIAKALRPIEVKGRDATFRIKKGTPRVVSSKVGRGVSNDDLAAAVAGVIDRPPGERRVTVPVGVREPALTTEQARGLGVKERLSKFTQGYPYAAYRSQNIGQAAKRVNGTLLMPGETFSLNDTIKERTMENGYTEGFVIGEGGIFAEDLGGGVSTSATAVWTAAFYAGMERVQNVAHSIYISRYTAGLEATVAWGIFDMKFRNDTPNAVFIKAGTTPTSITVSFWGTKEYDDIEAEFGERKNIKKFTKVYDTSDRCLGQSGVDGFTIVVDRVFYKDGEEVRREPITTTYKPAPQVICGKKPDKKKPGKGQPVPDPSASPEASATPPPSDAPAGDSPAAPDVPAPEPSPSPTKKPRN